MSSIPHILVRAFKVSRFYTGQFVCEIGGAMERMGSRFTDDIAYTQHLSRHRSILGISEVKPVVESAYVAPNSTLVGEVHVHQYASVWYKSTLRAELSPIRLGSYSTIGENTTVHTASALPTGVPASVTIGNHVTIQDNCTIFSSIIDDEAFIGSGSVIGEGCKIEKGAVIAPNSFVPPNRLIPGRQLWAGNPVKFLRDLTEEEVYANYVQTFETWNLAQKHMNDFVENEENTEGPKKDQNEIDPNSLVGSYISDNYTKFRSKYYF